MELRVRDVPRVQRGGVDVGALDGLLEADEEIDTAGGVCDGVEVEQEVLVAGKFGSDFVDVVHWLKLYAAA